MSPTPALSNLPSSPMCRTPPAGTNPDYPDRPDSDEDWEQIYGSEVSPPRVETGPMAPVLEEENPEGLGVKIDAHAPGVYVVAKTTYDASEHAQHCIEYYCLFDCSASMRGNGGSSGLRHTLLNLPAFGTRTDEKGPRNTLSGATFDACLGETIRTEACLLNCSEFSNKMIPHIHHDGAGTDIHQALTGALTDLQIRAKSMPREQRDKTIFTVVLATDGLANPPVSASELRSLVEDTEKSIKIAIQLSVISLGSATSAAFVTDVAGRCGLVGFAQDPASAEEAFIAVFGAIQKSRDIFRIGYNWVRNNAHSGEEDNLPGGAGVVQMGLVTENHIRESCSIPLPPGGLQVGDKLEVSCRGMKETITFQGSAVKTRDDLWAEMAVVQKIRAVQREFTRRDAGRQATIDAYVDLAARTNATPGVSRGLRNMTEAMKCTVLRSLSAPVSSYPSNDDQDHDNDDNGGDMQFRSLGRPPLKRSCGNNTPSAPHVAAEAASQGMF